MGALEATAHEVSQKASFDPHLHELVKIRASQINRCALHTTDARAGSESEHRIDTLSASHETPFFSQQERAVLTLTEEITLINQDGVTDEAFHRACEQFDDNQLATLLWGIVAINSRNRMATSTGSPARGSYHPTARRELKPTACAVADAYRRPLRSTHRRHCPTTGRKPRLMHVDTIVSQTLRRRRRGLTAVFDCACQRWFPRCVVSCSNGW